MGEAAVRHELGAVLAGHGFVGGVEHVFFELRVHLPVIGCEQGNGIDGVFGLIVPLSHGVSSVRVSFWKAAGAALVSSICLCCKRYATIGEGCMQPRGEEGC